MSFTKIIRLQYARRLFSNLSASLAPRHLYKLANNRASYSRSTESHRRLINSHSAREFCYGMDAARAYLNQFAGGAVTLEKDPTRGVAIVTISNPEKRNAMSGYMMVELHDRITELMDWAEGKALVLRGADGNFCSGGDLDFARASGCVEGAEAMNKWMLMTLRKLSELSMISVCLVEGPTLGGGTEMSLACDYILAAENVKYGVVHGRMGIVTAWGGGTRLVRRIGKHKALDLLLTSRILSAKECLEFGIADEIVSTSDALADTDRWLGPRLKHHYTVTRAMKEIALRAEALPLHESTTAEGEIFVPFWGGELNKAALAGNVKHVTK